MEAAETQGYPGWKNMVGWTAAVLMALLWLTAGVYKLIDLSGFQLKMTQLLVPIQWTLPGALALAVGEVFAAILLLRPAWRRLGGYLSVGLLLVFMAYMAYNYEALKGEDCSCFPWLKRAVGPAFFWSDGAMVALAALAAWFAPKPSRLRGAGYALIGVCALGGTMLAVDQFSPVADANVPAVIKTDDGELSLRQGDVFLYFFNPLCPHCEDAAKRMAQLNWKATFVGVPTQDYQFGPGFTADTGLKNVKLTPDLDLLKEQFPFSDVPYAVALKNGRVVERFRFFEDPALSDKIRELGLAQ